MHISDGVLSLEVVVAASVIAAIFLIYSINNLENEDITLVSSMSAMFFVASFIHIPIGPTQIHLVLIGIIGILLGKRVFLSISIALLLQAMLLGFGGLTTLGVNLIIMAVPAFMISVLYENKMLDFLNEKIKFFLIGFIPVLLSTLLLALMLTLAKDEFVYVSYTVIFANIPAMVIEGFITLFLLNYLKKSIPWVLNKANT